MTAPDHEAHMREAIAAASKNPAAPFGAVLVDRTTGQVVARGVNRSRANPTLHGEIAAINAYADEGGGDWQNLALYTTAEPCCMCQGAILWAGIAEVVYGTSIATLKELGWKQIDLTAEEVTARSWQPRPTLIPSVLESACDELFRRAKR